MGFIECKTEFCCNNNLIVVRLQCFPKQFLVIVRIYISAINFGGIKQCITHLHGIGKQGFHSLFVCRRAICMAHAHTSEAYR